MSKLFGAISLFFAFLFLVTTTHADNGRWDDNDHVSTRLISAVDAVGNLSEIPMGLEFQLKPDWKIYWRTPGDAGLPPVPDWSQSKNVKEVNFDWPLPYRFSVLGLETLGYKDEVVFPLQVTPENPSQPIHLKGDISYLVCSEICIPYNANVELSLDAGIANSSKQAHLISKYQAKVPTEKTAGGLVVDTIAQFAEGENFKLQLLLSADREITNPDIYIEGADGLFFGAPEVQFGEGKKTAALSMSGGGVPVEEYLNQPLTVTLYDDGGMLETRVVPQQGLVEFVGASNAISDDLVSIILLAILGGLILNLMPCVLPVLSLKLLSVVSHGGGNQSDVRKGFLATSVGIIFAFLVLAGALILLKASGAAIGWGIQFQQPIFLIFMVMILVLFAANMFGLFEFRLPGKISDVAVNSGPKKGLLGEFATGAFATLLATPCSAPFLGTAVGFALSRGPIEIILIFTSLGVGLAIPYIFVAIFPALATKLPKPGGWMIKLKFVLGLAILATAVWLLTVLVMTIGQENTLLVGMFATLMIAVFWAKSLPQSKLGRHAGKAAIVLVFAAVAIPVLKPVEPIEEFSVVRDDIWVEFDEKLSQKYVADGKTVFVDVTADWCITCKFNKKAVLDTEAISNWLASENVVAMRADWTRPNDVIAAYLASHGRYGIPFNIVYGPNNRSGNPLPELLSASDIAKVSKQVSENNQLVLK